MDGWKTPIMRFLSEGRLPGNKQEAKKNQNRSFRFQIYQGELYKKSWHGPLLLCVSDKDAPKVLAEVHEGWCRSHNGARSLAIKITRAGYYWPTLVKDSTAFSPVYYAQSNGQVEVMNRIRFKGIKKNILQNGQKEGNWVEELPTVLWSLCSTPNQAIRETPFSVVYGTNAVLSAEVGLPTYRQAGFDEKKNENRLKEQMNFTDELRDEALYKILKYKRLLARSYNRRVKNRQFVIGDLVLRLFSASHPQDQNKLSLKWEELEDLDGKLIPKTWHASKLSKYYV
ncbi:hypothetical protein LIER_17681 [Lithospermum erythrorhizon]|uniref:Integrase zinc-binding domain-containing protein n=1 Tax=Lithospermum erythrorhizon TaxID=34254 RepID=A0AAV3QFC5_LITER